MGEVVPQREIVEALQALLDNHLSAPPTANINDLWKEHQMVRKIIDTVTYSQKRHAHEAEEQPATRTQKDADAFVEWCDKNGVYHDGVQLAECPKFGGFGLKATRKIEKDEVIVTVPKELMLTAEMAKQSPILQIACKEDKLLATMDNVSMAILLLCERMSSTSKWKPYLNMLPQTFDLPLYWSIEELQKLRPSPVFVEALLFYRNVARQFCYFYARVVSADEFHNAKKGKRATMHTPLFHKTPFTLLNFTFEVYRWAVCCVSSRQNLLPAEEGKAKPYFKDGVPALIPFLDMANHVYDIDLDGYISVGYNDDEARAGITAYRNFDEGEFTPMYYGKRSNADHLLHNGFIPEGENPADRYKIKLPLPRSDKLFLEKRRLISQLGFKGWVQDNIYAFDLSMGDVPFHETLVGFAKVLVCDEATEEAVEQPDVLLKAARFLKDRFSLLARVYRIQEGTTPVEKMIERLHQGELDILTNAHEYCVGWERDLLDAPETSPQ